MQNKPERLGIGNSAKLLGVSVDTLRRWEKKGKVTSHRSPGGHRYFLRSDLEKVFIKKYDREKVKVDLTQPESRPHTLNKYLLITLGVFFVVDIILVTFYLLASK